MPRPENNKGWSKGKTLQVVAKSEKKENVSQGRQQKQSPITAGKRTKKSQ